MHQALAGRQVVVTRAAHQAGELIAALATAGATVIAYPLLRIEAPADPGPLDAALADLGAYAQVVFTSRNAVDETLRRAGQLGIAAERFPPAAVIGPGTARAARAAGLRVAGEAVDNDAESLLALLLADPTADPLFLPQADNARPLLAAGLRAAGRRVVAVEAYRSVDQVPSEPLPVDAVDAVVCASSATVRRLHTALGEPAWRLLRDRGCGFVAIGARTAATLREYGAERVAVAARPDDDGLVAAVAALCT